MRKKTEWKANIVYPYPEILYQQRDDGNKSDINADICVQSLQLLHDLRLIKDHFFFQQGCFGRTSGRTVAVATPNHRSHKELGSVLVCPLGNINTRLIISQGPATDNNRRHLLFASSTSIQLRFCIPLFTAGIRSRRLIGLSSQAVDDGGQLLLFRLCRIRKGWSSNSPGPRPDFFSRSVFFCLSPFPFLICPDDSVLLQSTVNLLISHEKPKTLD